MAIFPSQSGKSSAEVDLINLKDIEDWDQFNLEAQIQIFMTLDYEVASLVNGKEVAADLWAALKSRFEGKGLTAVAMLASKLWQYTILTKNDISMQIQDMKNIALKLGSLGYPLSNEYQAIAILWALPAEWGTIRSIILNKSGPFMLQGTMDALLEHENTLQQQHENVLVVCHDRKPRSPTPTSAKSKGPEKPVCSLCKKPGHTVNQCWCKGGGAEGQPKKRKSRHNLRGRGWKDTTANVVRDNQSPSPPANVYVLCTDEDALLSKDIHTSTDSSFFIIDSGALAHMCHDWSYYSSYQKIIPPKPIWIADDRVIDTVSIGDICIQTHQGRHTNSGLSKESFTFPNCACHYCQPPNWPMP